MRHRKAGRQLRRTSEQKLALMRGLATSLIEHGKIETTEAKAKELRPFVEKLITKARSRTLHDRRLLGRHIQKREAADKLFKEIGPRLSHGVHQPEPLLRLSERRRLRQQRLACEQSHAPCLEAEPPDGARSRRRQGDAGEGLHAVSAVGKGPASTADRGEVASRDERAMFGSTAEGASFDAPSFSIAPRWGHRPHRSWLIRRP
jgi:large subunit ribosomal protein L17